MLLDLLRPFSYLTIRHCTLQPQWVNWGVPLAVTGVLFMSGLQFGISPALTGSDGLITLVLSFVQTLAGFYIAALAAIASFSSADMDKPMPGEPPTMVIKYNGATTKVNVTRRRFLSSMFAYLTVCSLILTLVSIAALTLAKPLAAASSAEWIEVLKGPFVFIYVLALSQMVCVTLWGLYYLGERIHTPD